MYVCGCTGRKSHHQRCSAEPSRAATPPLPPPTYLVLRWETPDWAGECKLPQTSASTSYKSHVGNQQRSQTREGARAFVGRPDRRWCLDGFSGAERRCSPAVATTHLCRCLSERSDAACAHRMLSRSIICSSLSAVDVAWPDSLVADIPTRMYRHVCCYPVVRTARA